MIGVVVWANKGREQAVIWCDDHAALAYLVGRDHFSPDHVWPEPGDMVELGDEVQGDLRYARAVRPLTDSPSMRLSHVLNAPQTAVCNTPMAASRTSATVLPLIRKAG